MNDRIWLEKISTAYEVYRESNKSQEEVLKFLEWLHKQYGYEFQKKNNT